MTVKKVEYPLNSYWMIHSETIFRGKKYFLHQIYTRKDVAREVAQDLRKRKHYAVVRGSTLRGWGVYGRRRLVGRRGRLVGFFG